MPNDDERLISPWNGRRAWRDHQGRRRWPEEVLCRDLTLKEIDSLATHVVVLHHVVGDHMRDNNSGPGLAMLGTTNGKIFLSEILKLFMMTMMATMFMLTSSSEWRCSPLDPPLRGLRRVSSLVMLLPYLMVASAMLGVVAILSVMLPIVFVFSPESKLFSFSLLFTMLISLIIRLIFLISHDGFNGITE